MPSPDVARHQQPDLLPVGVLSIERRRRSCPWYITAIAISESQDLVELGGDDQHGHAFVRVGHDLRMDVLDRPDVQARWSAARRRAACRTARTLLQRSSSAGCLPTGSTRQLRSTACERRTPSTSSCASLSMTPRLSLMPLEKGASEYELRTRLSLIGKVATSPSLLAILGDVSDTDVEQLAGPHAGHVVAIERGSGPRPRDAVPVIALDQFGLSVPLDARRPPRSRRRAPRAIRRRPRPGLDRPSRRGRSTSSTGAPGLGGGLLDLAVARRGRPSSWPASARSLPRESSNRRPSHVAAP